MSFLKEGDRYAGGGEINRRKDRIRSLWRLRIDYLVLLEPTLFGFSTIRGRMLLGNESGLDWHLYQSRADYMDHELETKDIASLIATLTVALLFITSVLSLSPFFPLR